MRWDFSYHSGCKATADGCNFGRRELINLNGLSPLIKIRLARRGGHKGDQIDFKDIDGYVASLRRNLSEEDLKYKPRFARKAIGRAFGYLKLMHHKTNESLNLTDSGGVRSTIADMQQPSPPQCKRGTMCQCKGEMNCMYRLFSRMISHYSTALIWREMPSCYRN